MVSVKMNKISKTISIPYWYRYGFYESDTCYSAEILFKTAKKGKKPYLYHTSIDMVFVKMNKISKTISIPYWYRYGFLEVLLKK